MREITGTVFVHSRGQRLRQELCRYGIAATAADWILDVILVRLLLSPPAAVARIGHSDLCQPPGTNPEPYRQMDVQFNRIISFDQAAVLLQQQHHHHLQNGNPHASSSSPAAAAVEGPICASSPKRAVSAFTTFGPRWEIQ